MPDHFRIGMGVNTEMFAEGLNRISSRAQVGAIDLNRLRPRARMWGWMRSRSRGRSWRGLAQIVCNFVFRARACDVAAYE